MTKLTERTLRGVYLGSHRQPEALQSVYEKRYFKANDEKFKNKKVFNELLGLKIYF